MKIGSTNDLKGPELSLAHVSTAPITHVERVHIEDIEADARLNCRYRLLDVIRWSMHNATNVCNAFQDLNALTAHMNRLQRFIK